MVLPCLLGPFLVFPKHASWIVLILSPSWKRPVKKIRVLQRRLLHPQSFCVNDSFQRLNVRNEKYKTILLNFTVVQQSTLR